MRLGAVVSDLHLLTDRTTVHEHMTDIRRAADECELFVFNGDIFDFKWSKHRGFDESVRAAEQWIRDLVCAHPSTRFVFILGNHDSVPAYQDALDKLRRELPNLEWRPVWYRNGGRLFLHGDMCRAGPSVEELVAYRRRCNRTLRRSRFHHLCYKVIDGFGLPALLVRFVSRKTCARRIMGYMSDEMGHRPADIEEVYFGHVHTPFADFRYQNVVFHNTGAALRGLRLSVIRFEL